MIPEMGVSKYKYPMKMNKFGLIETKLFHFHRIFNSGEGGANPLWIRHCNALPITY